MVASEEIGHSDVVDEWLYQTVYKEESSRTSFRTGNGLVLSRVCPAIEVNPPPPKGDQNRAMCLESNILRSYPRS